MSTISEDRAALPSHLATSRRPAATTTPINLRPSRRTKLDDATREHVRRRMGRQLGKLAPRVERVTVRFDDVNGLRGGRDQACTIKVVLDERPSVVTEARAHEARAAFDAAAAKAERAVRRSVQRARPHLTRRRPSVNAAARVQAGRAAAPARSLIGRREGQSDANLEAVLSSAGGTNTATRNVKRNARRATAALEDSLQDRPSRKSTRGSSNRAKQGSKLQRRQVRRTHSSKARARRAKRR